MTAEVTERRQRQRSSSQPSPFDELQEVETSTPARAIARVDLVPPIVGIRRKNRATISRLMIGLLGLVLIIAAASVGVAFLAGRAESALDTERARTLTLLQEQQSYSEVSSVIAQLGGYDGAEISALYSEADWARLQGELDTVLPDDITLATETVVIKGLDAGASAIEATGLDAPGVIEISFTANAARFDSPTPLLNALSQLTGYVSATVSAVAESGESGYTITGVVQLGADALGGTARVGELDADTIAQLHEQLELKATTIPGSGTTDAGTDTATEGDTTSGTGE